MQRYTILPRICTRSARLLRANLARRHFSTTSQRLAEFPPPPEIRHALPAQWYSSHNLYDLERRAIFSKKWMLITHRLRLLQRGDYLRFQVAGFSFVLLRDGHGAIRGFHNVCRHRAYPLVSKDEGNSNVLFCKYHGWLYNLTGKLVKAPDFDKLAGFDKSQHGLFPVHVHIDKRGFIWVNLDAAAAPVEKWEDDFLGIDTTRSNVEMKDFRFDHKWRMDGAFNWKTLMDNFNECYHCKTCHPGIASLSDLSTYDVEGTGGAIKHFVPELPPNEGEDSGSPLFLFPNTTVSMSTSYLYLMRAIPTGPTSVSLEYEVYRDNKLSDEEFGKMDAFVKQVEKEDWAICNAAQKNLDAGCFVGGPLHPGKEKGVLYFQSRLRLALEKHLQSEREAGGEIWPARRQGPMQVGFKKDVRFCENVECSQHKDKIRLESF